MRSLLTWLMRTFPEAPAVVEKRLEEQWRPQFGHDMAKLIANPNPYYTGRELWMATVLDFAFGNAYWLKVRRTDGELGLVRLPPPSVAVDGWLLPKLFVWTLPSGETMELEAGQVVYFSGYNPDSPVEGLSPLETLRQLGYPADGLRAKSWHEFAAAGAPAMGFVFTVCDNAAGEVCPAWPGQPMTAHWGIEDPAAVEGTPIQKLTAFATAFRYLRNRISLFRSLPFASLDHLALQNRVREIGRTTDAPADT